MVHYGVEQHNCQYFEMKRNGNVLADLFTELRIAADQFELELYRDRPPVAVGFIVCFL